MHSSVALRGKIESSCACLSVSAQAPGKQAFFFFQRRTCIHVRPYDTPSMPHPTQASASFRISPLCRRARFLIPHPSIQYAPRRLSLDARAREWGPSPRSFADAIPSHLEPRLSHQLSILPPMAEWSSILPHLATIHAQSTPSRPSSRAKHPTIRNDSSSPLLTERASSRASVPSAARSSVQPSLPATIHAGRESMSPPRSPPYPRGMLLVVIHVFVVGGRKALQDEMGHPPHMHLRRGRSKS